MTGGYQIDAISGVSNPDEIRVVILSNNRFVHAPLPALLQALTARVTTLEAQVANLQTRVTALESA